MTIASKFQGKKKKILFLFFLLIVSCFFIPKLDRLAWRVISIGEFKILAILSKFAIRPEDKSVISQAKLSSHRGVTADDVIENSERSIIQAAQNGFQYIEIDVSFSKDYTPFIFHDLTLKLKTNLDMLTREASWDDIQKLKLPDDQKIINLKHFISRHAQLFEGIILDIKTDNNNFHEKAKSFINVVGNSKYLENIYIIGRPCGVISKIKNLKPQLKVGCENLGILHNYMTGKDLISLHHRTQFSLLGHYFANKLNLATILWTVNNSHELNQLRRLDNTIIITDMKQPYF